jgi:hypothetical protein
MAPPHLQGTRLYLHDDGSVIGRAGDLAASGNNVSREHARLWRESGALWIEDNASKNGTFLNGRRIESAMSVRNGDVIRIGDVYMRLQEAGPPRPMERPPLDRHLPPMYTETTRYLCGAMQLDASLCRQVIREVVDQPYRALGPPYGVDAVAVVGHALMAHRRRLVRDVVLLMVGAATVILCVVKRPSVTGLSAPSAAKEFLDKLWPVLILALVLACLVVGVETCMTLFVVKGRLSAGHFNPGAVRPRTSARVRERLRHLAATENGNVIVFRNFRPFVGSGFPAGAWSFAIDISKGPPDPKSNGREAPTPFDTAELYQHLIGALSSIGLPVLRVDEQLLIDGLDVRKDAILLPNPLAPPVTHVDRSVLARSLGDSESAARTYLCVQVTGWRGQLISTLFVRAVKLRGSLFLECTAFLLPPLKAQYYRVDESPPRTALEALGTTLGIVTRRTLPLLFASPAHIFTAVHGSAAASRTRKRQRRAILDGQPFNYGAVTSLREEAAGDEYNRYFLMLDHEMYAQVVQERLLKSVEEFLTSHGVDTAEFGRQQLVINQTNTVKNRNIMVGNVSGQGIAIGSKARAAVGATPDPSA